MLDEVGLDVFSIGEHHRKEFQYSATAVILAAPSRRTIPLTGAVTVLSTANPVRVYQNFATLDLVSKGRPILSLAVVHQWSLFALRIQSEAVNYSTQLIIQR